MALKAARLAADALAQLQDAVAEAEDERADERLDYRTIGVHVELPRAVWEACREAKARRAGSPATSVPGEIAP